MIPILTPDEMAGVDRRAGDDLDALVARAGAAVAHAALARLRPVYGSRVVIVCGKGHNGDDGRAARHHLERRGVAVTVVDAGTHPVGQDLPAADLVIDAAYGSGLQRGYTAPPAGGAPVLAVDLPSGLSGLTGEMPSPGFRADATVTFAALKPGLLFAEGPEHSGTIEVADIGLGGLAADVARSWLVTDADVAAAVPARAHEAHKWQSALQVVAGSPGMSGAPWMVSRAALRAGAGYVRLGVPGARPEDLGLPPGELVCVALPDQGWGELVGGALERFAAAVVGPGLGDSGLGADGQSGVGSEVASLLTTGYATPAVVDADGIRAIGTVDALRQITAKREAATVLTPHAGEYARLVGDPPGSDRIASVRRTAVRSGAVVLLKGSATIVAAPDGRVLVAASGTARLATAGTGDALAGVIGALVARGLPPFEAAAFAAHVHGRAADLGRAEGLVASDLPDLVSRWLSAAVTGAGRADTAPVIG